MLRIRVLLAVIALGAMSAPLSSARGIATGRGPWDLALLPGMGVLTWSCADNAPEPRRYALGFRTDGQTATETLTLAAGGHSILRRRFDPGITLQLPHLPYARQRIVVRQRTEPGPLRAVVDVDFSPRPVSPSHCYPYLPPRITVHIYPR